MAYKLGLTLVTALMLAGSGMFGSVSESAARTAQNGLAIATDISSQAKEQKKGKARPRKAGPRNVGPQRSTSQQRSVSPQRSTSQRRSTTQRRSTSQQRSVSPQRSTTQRRGITQQRDVGQRKFSRIRDASRARIAGRNYSIWRDSYRVRRGSQWRTFVGLSALGALMFGSAYYYPYAYIDAPAPYCEGLTEDGCQLRWRAVPTLEGRTEFVCVAYCPWL